MDIQNISNIVYARSTQEGFDLPTRKKALSVFNKYFQSHRSYQRGRVKRLYYKTNRGSITPKHLQTIVREYAKKNKRRFRFLFERCYLLFRHTPDAKKIWRIHYPSTNTRLPVPGETRGGWTNVYNKDMLETALTNLGNVDMWAGLKINEGTAWSLPLQPWLEIVLVVKPVLGARIGAKLEIPEIYLQNKWGRDIRTEVDYNQCFFVCYAMWKYNKKEVTKARLWAKKTYLTFYGLTLEPPKKQNWVAMVEDYAGICPEELARFEEDFNVSIWIYELQTSGEYTFPNLLRTGCDDKPIMRLCQHGNHFMLIHEPAQFGHCYPCKRCGALISTKKKLTRHFKTCKNKTREISYPKIKLNKRNEPIFPYYEWNKCKQEVFKEYGRYMGFIVYDCEVYMPLREVEDKSLSIRADHHLASIGVGICSKAGISSVVLRRGYEESESNFLARFLGQLMEYQAIIAKENWKIQKQNIELLKIQIERLEGQIKFIKRQGKKTHLYEIAKGKKEAMIPRLIEWTMQVPTFGFNSGKYDMNLIKQMLPNLNTNLRTQLQLIMGLERKYEELDFAKMIKTYENQDKCAKRSIKNALTPGYLEAFTTEHCRLMDGFKCIYCKSPLDAFQRNIGHGFTLDRIDDSKGHQKGNVVIACLSCNRQHLNRSLCTEIHKTAMGSTREIDTLEKLVFIAESQPVQSLRACTNIKMVFSTLFKFHDIRTLLPPCNLRMFIDTWAPNTLGKLWFPYEWLQSLEVLKQKEMPPREKWYSWLRDENEVTPENYEIMQEIWKEQKCKNMGDLLAFYNKQDIEPFALAIKNFADHYYEKYENADILKNFASISAFSLYHCMKSAHLGDPTEKIFPLIVDQDKDLYELMMASKIGGYSAPLMTRYREAGVSKLKGGMVERVQSWDFNALYLYCISQDMPSGKYTRNKNPKMDILDKVADGSFFGFLQVDGFLPDEHKHKFRGLLPIFKRANIEPKEEIIGETMYKLMKKYGDKRKATTKLINSWSCQKKLMFTPYLKWLLSVGFHVTKVYQTLTFEDRAPYFAEFAEEVSDARRLGDIKIDGKKPYKLIGETQKAHGNTCYGRIAMNKDKHRHTDYTTDLQEEYAALATDFIKSEKVAENCWEVTRLKRKITHDSPLYISIAVYQYAKLHLLKFQYWLDSHIDTDKLDYCYSDTDCLVMAIAGDSLDEIVRPEMQESWNKTAPTWFQATGQHIVETIEWNGQKFDLTEQAHDRRTPGKIKIEFDGKGIAAVASKSCFLWGAQKLDCDDFFKRNGVKMSSKGINKFKMVKSTDSDDQKLKELYIRLIKQENIEDKEHRASNKGFKVQKTDTEQRMVTYEMNKVCLSYYFDKAKVQANMIDLLPLSI